MTAPNAFNGFSNGFERCSSAAGTGGDDSIGLIAALRDANAPPPPTVKRAISRQRLAGSAPAIAQSTRLARPHACARPRGRSGYTHRQSRQLHVWPGWAAYRLGTWSTAESGRGSGLYARFYSGIRPARPSCCLTRALCCAAVHGGDVITYTLWWCTRVVAATNGPDD